MQALNLALHDRQHSQQDGPLLSTNYLTPLPAIKPLPGARRVPGRGYWGRQEPSTQMIMRCQQYRYTVTCIHTGNPAYSPSSLRFS